MYIIPFIAKTHAAAVPIYYDKRKLGPLKAWIGNYISKAVFHPETWFGGTQGGGANIMWVGS